MIVAVKEQFRSAGEGKRHLYVEFGATIFLLISSQRLHIVRFHKAGSHKEFYSVQ